MNYAEKNTAQLKKIICFFKTEVKKNKPSCPLRENTFP